MTKVEEIRKRLADLEELEKKQFEEEQSLLRELRKAEQEEKESRFEGNPQFFRAGFGYGGDYYVAAKTKEEAINTLLSYNKNLDADKVKACIETLGVQVIFKECTCTR